MAHTDSRQFTVQRDGIGHLLKDKRLRVPAYQRSYSWFAENAVELFQDIESAFLDLENEYFLGTIVLAGSDNDSLDVVDGQQRLTTVAILISCIRDFFKPKKQDPQAAEAIERDFIATLSRRGGQKEARLRLNEIDNPLYEECIVQGKERVSFTLNKSSHMRLVEVKKEATNFVSDFYNRQRKPEKLHDLLDYIEKKVKVILVLTPDNSNAFVIFEALNDRGLDLAISDLIKNYLFHKSSERIDEVRSKWQQMTGILESASDDPILIPYLRHFFSARYGVVREKELFTVIKKRVDTRKSVVDFSQYLLDSAKKYSALLHHEHDLWMQTETCRESIRSLNLLGMIQVRPLLLAAIEKFQPKELDVLLPKIVSAAVRFQVVGGNGASSLEKIYCSCAKQISEGSFKTAQEVITGLTSVPNDEDFKRQFAFFSISRSNLARYYLQALESELNREDAQLIPNPSANKVNIEHILPLAPNDQWNKIFSAESHRAHNRRLGNLTLIGARVNSTIGNSAFSKKKEVYENSPFKITKSLSKFDKWNLESINSRQAEMAVLAVRVWSWR